MCQGTLRILLSFEHFFFKSRENLTPESLDFFHVDFDVSPTNLQGCSAGCKGQDILVLAVL